MDYDYMAEFTLNPFEDIYYIDPDIFKENVNSTFYEELITEAKNGTTKKNIFQKIWEVIKKVFKWIADQFKKFINWIKNIFKKENTKSADQILEENNVKKVAAMAAGGVALAGVLKLTIPSDEKSEVDMSAAIDLEVKQLTAQFNKDKRSVIFNLSDVKSFRHKNVDSSGMAIKSGAANADNPLYVFAWIKYPRVVDEFIKIFNYITTNNSIDKNTLVKMYDNFVEIHEDSLRLIKAFPDMLVEINLDDIDNFNNKVIGFNKMAEAFDKPENIAKIDNNADIIEVTNGLSRFSILLQFGLNQIFSSMNKIYEVDARYNESINDINKLSEIVYEFIKTGMPYKYIARNVYIISSKNIRGEADIDKPKWGQTRVVFINKKQNRVHKIAMNQGGIRANIGEDEVYKTFASKGGSSLLTKVLGITDNKCIIDHEWANMDASKTHDQLSNLKTIIKHFTTINNINLDVNADLHSDNVGYVGSKLVATDYGLLFRKSNIN